MKHLVTFRFTNTMLTMIWLHLLRCLTTTFHKLIWIWIKTTKKTFQDLHIRIRCKSSHFLIRDIKEVTSGLKTKIIKHKSTIHKKMSRIIALLRNKIHSNYNITKPKSIVNNIWRLKNLYRKITIRIFCRKVSRRWSNLA